MARLSSVKRILTESFPELKWMPQLLAPLNQFIEEVNRALNKELTIAENFDGDTKTVTLDGTFPVKFRWERKSRPTVAWIGRCREISEVHTNFTAALFLDWEYSGDGDFIINAVPGLSFTDGDENPVKYNLTVVVLAR